MDESDLVANGVKLDVQGLPRLRIAKQDDRHWPQVLRSPQDWLELSMEIAAEQDRR